MGRTVTASVVLTLLFSRLAHAELWPIYKPHEVAVPLSASLFGGTPAVDGKRDFDGDGFADIVIAVPGKIQVVSGRTGETILLTSPALEPGFGAAVAAIDDFNADGRFDIVVGIPNTFPNKGKCKIFSGANGELLAEWAGNTAGFSFGYSVIDLGDVNGDTISDVGIGDVGPFTAGNVQVRSGATGAVLYGLQISTCCEDYFGASLTRVRDRDGDGVDEIAVGAPYATWNGAARVGIVSVFSGKTGILMHQLYGDKANDAFGASIDSAGGILVVGAPGVVAMFGQPPGYVRCHFLDQGNSWTVQGFGVMQMGFTVAVVENFHQYPIPGTPPNTAIFAGVKTLFPLINEGAIFAFDVSGISAGWTPASSGAAFKLASARDLDGGTTQELLLGEVYPIVGAKVTSYASADGQISSFGSSCGVSLHDINPANFPPETPPPTLAINGAPIEGELLRVEIIGGYGTSLLFASLQPASGAIPVFANCSFLLDPSAGFAAPLVLPPAPFELTVPPGIPAGTEIYFQALTQDPFLAWAHAVSQGVKLRFVAGEMADFF